VTDAVPWLARMRSDIAGIAWPPVKAGPHAALAALLRQLEDTQWLDPAALAAAQFRQLRLLAAYCARHSDQFRARLRGAGLGPDDLGGPAGLARLPPLRRRDIQSAGDALFCETLPAGQAPAKASRTSGSTGEPVLIRRTAVNGMYWAALTLREHLWHRRDFRGRFSAVRAHVGAYREAASWGRPASLLFDTGPAQVMPIATDVAEQIARLRAFRPDNLLTYPNNLEALARACASDGVRFPGLRHVRTIGETLRPEVRALAEEVFGVPVADVYSSEEFGLVAIQCPQSGLYHVMAESVIVEVLNESGAPSGDGEIGELVITDLHNFATPLIRYAIADYAEPAGACPCGRGLPTLRRIVGRERNLVVVPDGRRYWPTFGFHRFRDIAPIQQYQLIQEAPDRIELRLVAERPLDAAQEDQLRAVIQENLKYPFALRFTYFDDRIPRAANGKFEDFICKVAQ
jgi:phenylacetate-CoA ligase